MKELSRVVQSEFEKGTMLYKQANRLIVEQDDVSTPNGCLGHMIAAWGTDRVMPLVVHLGVTYF